MGVVAVKVEPESGSLKKDNWNESQEISEFRHLTGSVG